MLVLNLERGIRDRIVKALTGSGVPELAAESRADAALPSAVTYYHSQQATLFAAHSGPQDVALDDSICQALDAIPAWALANA